MFAPLTPLRLGDDTAFNSSKVIVLLPGGSNPIWEGDWVDVPCHESSLLNAFSERILHHYQITLKRPIQKQLTLTFIDRTGSRRLRNQDSFFSTLQKEFPEVRIELVDFAAMPLVDQVRLVRSTDILLGVHGAGLTHKLFLTQGSAVVEILPENMNYKGFANMAKLLGQHYFSRHGTGNSDDSGDWHADDVSIDKQEFLDLVGEAVSRARG